MVSVSLVCRKAFLSSSPHLFDIREISLNFNKGRKQGLRPWEMSACHWNGFALEVF